VRLLQTRPLRLYTDSYVIRRAVAGQCRVLSNPATIGARPESDWTAVLSDILRRMIVGRDPSRPHWDKALGGSMTIGAHKPEVGVEDGRRGITSCWMIRTAPMPLIDE
jgi:hypothetical protein